jgi:hypothetical protein
MLSPVVKLSNIAPPDSRQEQYFKNVIPRQNLIEHPAMRQNCAPFIQQQAGESETL